jgi:hypothetical protein
VTAFLVPADVAGLSFGPNEHKMGWNAQPTRQVILDEVRVPASAVLGEVGGGFRIAMKGLNGGASTSPPARSAVRSGRSTAPCAMCTSASRSGGARRTTVGRVRPRRHGDELVAARASSSAPLGDRRGRARRRRAMRDGEALRDGCRVRDRQPGAAAHGGYGYLQEYGIEKVVRDLRVHQILEGTNEIMRRHRPRRRRGMTGRPELEDWRHDDYETILVETRGRVGWITLNRPEALNALNSQVMRDVVAAAGRSTPTRRSARSS